MSITTLKIKDLINTESKLTFLVGAGCSVDLPSCLPAGKEMMNAIIDYTCEGSEIDEIKKLEELRFEQIVEILRDSLDPKLKVIDFYELCAKPNLQHFFIAEMIKQGQFVLTTNFDFLIEHALQQSGVPKEEIQVVITQNDFETYSNPQELYSSGIKALYKIHGSTLNQITQEDTREYLVATIQAFGTNKEGVNVFQLEGFKHPAFRNLTKGRSLVVIGYSGSDDFDIVPTLKALNQIQDIIWINYVHIDEGKEIIYEIKSETDTVSSKVDQILVDIKQMNYVKRVFRVDVNTTRMVRNLFTPQNEISSDKFNVDVYKWLSNNIILPPPHKIVKLYVPYKIYQSFDRYSECLRILERILKIAIYEDIKEWEGFALNEMGLLYKVQGNYPEALKRYEEALKAHDQSVHLGSEILKSIAATLNNIGEVFIKLGDYSEALKRFEQALQIDEQLGDLRGKAERLGYIGGIIEAQGDNLEALKRFKLALQIDEQIGNLIGKAARLSNIAAIYREEGNYPEALKLFQIALQIDEKLGNLSGKANDLNSMGLIYEDQENYIKAMELYEKAFIINEKLGNLSGMSSCLCNVGAVYYKKENFLEALELYRTALQIREKLGNLENINVILKNISKCLNNIGMIYYDQYNYPEAMKLIEEALQIAEQSEDFNGKLIYLNHIGNIYEAQRKYPKALKYYKKALNLAEQLENFKQMAVSLNNIGMIYYTQKSYPEAIKYFEDALKIAEQLENLDEKTKILNNIGLIYFQQENFQKAIKCLEESLEILAELGLEDSPTTQDIKVNINYIKSMLR